jgi:protein-ribulosamine 3-kinase
LTDGSLIHGLAAALSAALGHDVAPGPESTVHGGSINDCYRWKTAAGPVFVKVCPDERRWILDAEADGLRRLRGAGALAVPAVLAEARAGEVACLALEWLELRRPDTAAERRLGAALARLHRVQGPAFGLERDNAIGATPQSNGSGADWPAFWRVRRLGAQLDLAARNGYGGRLQDRGRRLLEHVADFFRDYAPAPSLLHGDLWAGNRAALAGGVPVVFDPAVYYGDREADLAMTRLFGGFGADFYAAYVEEWPLDTGAASRRDLYNLYHVLNHLNLFGGSYRTQAEAMIDRLLAAVGL